MISLRHLCRSSVAQHPVITRIQYRTGMFSALSVIQRTVTENLGGSAHASVPHGQNFSIDDVPDQAGKVAVITGIGYATASALLRHNVSKLYVLSLSHDTADYAKRDMAQQLGGDRADRTVWIQCDLADWNNVRAAAKHICDTSDRLDILVNNAGRGIMTAQLTDYGVDRHMAVNHFGHAVLTSQLLPHMKETANRGNVVRIVNLSSNAHQSAPSDLTFSKVEEINSDHGPDVQYGISKLATLLYSRWLARHLKESHPRILVNAVHPGVVNTRQSLDYIHEGYPWAGYAVSTFLRPFKKSPLEGCMSSLYAATLTHDSGEYICPPAVSESGSKLSQSEMLQENLMELTERVISEHSVQGTPLC